MNARRRLAEAGFTIVETLIALAIIATTMAATFQSVATNARATQAMIDRRMATLIAKSVLDSAVGTNGVDREPRDGLAGALRWHVDVDPYQPRNGAAPALDLVTVTVMRQGDDRPVLRLRSLRLGR